MSAALHVLLKYRPCLEGDVAYGPADRPVCQQLCQVSTNMWAGHSWEVLATVVALGRGAWQGANGRWSNASSCCLLSKRLVHRSCRYLMIVNWLKLCRTISCFFLSFLHMKHEIWPLYICKIIFTSSLREEPLSRSSRGRNQKRSGPVESWPSCSPPPPPGPTSPPYPSS